MNTVKALVCNKPGSLSLMQRPVPQLTPGRVLVRPLRVGICGTDYHIFEGKHPFLQYPRIMGHELAVEVMETTEGSHYSPGELCVVNPYVSCGECVACLNGKRNCCVRISVLGVHEDGGMTEHLAILESNLIPSDGLTADESATVEFLAIGAHAVRRGSVGGRDRVLVVGAGPIGLGVALFARLSGGDVTVLDIDEERARAAEMIAGITATGSAEADEYDLVFDATGNPKSMEGGFSYVAHGGRYVLVSVVKEPITFQDPDFHRKEISLFASRNATSEDFERVIAAIRAKDIPVDRLITHRTSLADAERNIPLWANEKAGLIKALIEIGE